MNSSVPTRLEHVLALSPIPIIGEIKAVKLAVHLADQDEARMSSFSLRGYDRAANIQRRFLAARGFGYLLAYGTVMGSYILSKT